MQSPVFWGSVMCGNREQENRLARNVLTRLRYRYGREPAGINQFISEQRMGAQGGSKRVVRNPENAY